MYVESYCQGSCNFVTCQVRNKLLPGLQRNFGISFNVVEDIGSGPAASGLRFATRDGRESVVKGFESS